jgi:Cu/Ag efflux pump CusA
MRDALVDIPGMAFSFSQPIQCRIDELVAGTRAQIILKLFGNDVEVLKSKTEEIARILSTINGVADLVFVNLPFALMGGVFALWVCGLYLSVPASVGFIVLFGVAVLNGLVLVSYMAQLHGEDATVHEAAEKACDLRLRPILMTASITVFSLIPMLYATGPGSEIQKPLAVVVVGGLFTSTLATLLVLPSMYGWFCSGSSRVPQQDNEGHEEIKHL